MLLPTLTAGDLCPSKLLHPRSFTSDVVSTAESFKSWDTCMDNKTCKIVAIVGIVLAVLFVLWLLSAVVNCVCCGAQTLCAAMLCCGMCCRGEGGNDSQRRQQGPAVYDNPHMYPPQQSSVPYGQRDYTQYDNGGHNNGFNPHNHYMPGVVEEKRNY